MGVICKIQFKGSKYRYFVVGIDSLEFGIETFFSIRGPYSVPFGNNKAHSRRSLQILTNPDDSRKKPRSKIKNNFIRKFNFSFDKINDCLSVSDSLNNVRLLLSKLAMQDFSSQPISKLVRKCLFCPSKDFARSLKFSQEGVPFKGQVYFSIYIIINLDSASS